MRTAGLRPGNIFLLFLFIGSHLFLAGCRDDSRTSGTVVEVSGAAKEHIQSRRDAYKAKADATAKTNKNRSKAKKGR
jgi:hypothetical protein